MTNIIRYGRMNSTGEVIIMFSGSDDAAATLDVRIARINDVLKKGRFVSKDSQPIVRESLEGSVLEETADAGNFRLYTLRGDFKSPQIRKWAYETFESYLDDYVAKNRRMRFDYRKGRPISAKGENKESASAAFKEKKEAIRRWKGSALRRQQELLIYVHGFSDLVAGVKPPNYVLHY